MGSARILDAKHDLVRSGDDKGWYIQEFANDNKGTSRSSKLYPTSRDAWTAYRDSVVEYGKWE